MILDYLRTQSLSAPQFLPLKFERELITLCGVHTGLSAQEARKECRHIALWRVLGVKAAVLGSRPNV